MSCGDQAEDSDEVWGSHLLFLWLLGTNILLKADAPLSAGPWVSRSCADCEHTGVTTSPSVGRGRVCNPNPTGVASFLLSLPRCLQGHGCTVVTRGVSGDFWHEGLEARIASSVPRTPC